MDEERAPAEVREEVRAGVRAAITRDVELRGGRTARLLATAGAVGAVGAAGLTLLLSGHPYDHHPPWHVVGFSVVWAGLLVVSLALVLLQVRTPELPLGRSASVAVLGLGISGICGVLCPDPHFLHWWAETEVGAAAVRTGGPALAALCFGAVTALVAAAAAALLTPGDRTRRALRPALPAAFLLALLSPGIALQTVGSGLPVFAAWLLGAAAGCYAGVAAGLRGRALLGAL